MKNLFLVFILFSLSTSAFAQVNPDSLKQKASLAKDRVTSINIDSLTRLPAFPDTLLPPFQKVDSIRNQFNEEAANIKGQYQNSISKIDSATGKLNNIVDSLQALNLPANKYRPKLDSLNKLREQTTAKFTAKADALKSVTTDKLKGLDLPPQYNEPLQQLTKNVDGFGLNSEFVKIPELNIPAYDLPKINGIGDLTSKVGEVGKIGNLPKIETPIGDLGQVTEQAKAYQDDIKNISQGNLNDVKAIPETIEAQAAKIEGVGELQKSTGVIDEYKGQLEAIKDPNAGKELAVEKIKEVAIDHFAGKQEQLKAAMDKMAKYKQKYSSVSSIKDLPKRPPNAMKGKPFIERVIPGLYFQYQQKNHNLFDVNPYVGYRISGRFTSGIGWNQRFAYDRRSHDWNSRSSIFGPRAYVDFFLKKGFIAHMETEVMNTFVPATIRFATDAGHREWVWGLMTGLKKEYKIYKNLRGTVLLQYNIFNPKYKAPYVDRLNSRIGFEYTLKKKKLKQPKN